MDAKELLKNWPEFAKANAARVLSSPAWRIEARYDGKPAVVTRSGDVPLPRISLSVTFDGTSRIVTFAPSPLFPDLWELRDRLKELPAEILLALVEKECGPLFQFFEDASRQSFSIAGLSDKEATGYSFKLTAEGGEIDFAVELSATVEQLLGQISNLDVTHASIRALTREVAASYGAFEMSDEEIAALKAGDCLVLPEDAVASWAFEFPDDALVRIVAAETRQATFAEIADETLGPVPAGGEVKVCRRGREIAAGVFSKLGEASVVKVLSLIR